MRTMVSNARNRLLLLGALWGLILASLPALVMSDGESISAFLPVALLFAALSGAVGTAVAGRRAERAPGAVGSPLVSGVKTGAVQGLVGGTVAALLFYALMAVTISGYSPGGGAEASVLMSPRVFLGSFFVALSVFVYSLAGGLLLGPLFGPLVRRAVGGKGGRGKEEPVVR